MKLVISPTSQTKYTHAETFPKRNQRCTSWFRNVGRGIFPDRGRWRRRAAVVRRAAKRWRWRPESDPQPSGRGVGRCLG